MRRPLPSMIAALLTVVLAAGCGSDDAPPHRFNGAVPDQHDPKPAFTLTSTDGSAYDLEAETADRPLLLYFGYTHCPDECPTAMADIAAALRRTDPSVSDQVDVVFVTTDPRRDTGPVLARWLGRFDPDFVGLRGSPSELAGVQSSLGMPISSRAPASGKDKVGRYAVDHFAAVLAYGSDGRLATLYPSGITPAEIAEDLPYLVEG